MNRLCGFCLAWDCLLWLLLLAHRTGTAMIKLQKTSSIRSTTTTTKSAMIIIINWQIEWNSWTGKCREHWDGFFFSSDSRKSLNLLQRALATAAAATKWRCVLASFELLRHRNSLDIVVPNGNDNDINVFPSEHCTSQFSSLPMCVSSVSFRVS